MGSYTVARVLGIIAAGLSTLACNSHECEPQVACGPSVTVTLKESRPIEDQELTFEVAFDGRVLRCRSTKSVPAGIGACDTGLSLQLRVDQPDAGASKDNPGEWPSFVEGVRLYDASPAQLTVRIQRGDETLGEQSFQPTYVGGYSESACMTCRSSQVWM